MKKIMLILGIMMMLTMSMAMATPGMVDDFNHPDGTIDGTSLNNLGYAYMDYNGIAGGGTLLSGCNYLNQQLHCNANPEYYYNFIDFSAGENIEFDIMNSEGITYFQIVEFPFAGGDYLYNTMNDNGAGVYTWTISSQDNGGWTGTFVSGTWYHIKYVIHDLTSVEVFIDDVSTVNLTMSGDWNANAYSFNHNAGGKSLYMDNIEVTVDNTAPVINSISPNERVELTQGDSQLYTSDVTDDDGDASYSWTLGSTEVSTGTTYTANWEDIEPGIYTLTLTVDDGEFQDSASVTLEIRAKGGSSGSSITPSFSIVQQEVVEEEQEYEVTADQATPQTSAFSKFTGNVGNFFSSIGSWFGGLFR